MTKWETAAPMVAETPDIKLFGKWSTNDVQINDISPQDYIAVKEKYAKHLPHSAGWYATKHFYKAQCPIEEWLTNSMMIHGCNNCKKLMTVCIVKHALKIIHLFTGKNPLQVLVNAIINSGLHALGKPGLNIKTIAECLADELINVTKSSSNSYAIKKDKLEHVAKSNH
ncbi:ribosomal protein S5 [Saguinus oedipus]|uniref:Ribosomal protein S5 n=1 Tax=Saguinus oedipus TaxID=9490 RepID=A0ABQ9TG27_SAGOE|nr:ribosomal protein S5 [Saguinus oedipus]